MPKFRDLVKNILYEDVEEEEEVEEPEVQVKPVKTRPAVQKTEQTETIVAKEPAKTTMFGELSMESVSSPDGSAPVRPAGKQQAARKPYLESRRNPNREYQAVLSPIFGNMEEDEKDLASVHDAIKLNKPNEEFDLVRVISPIYGTQVQTPAPKPAPEPKESVEVQEEEPETIDLKTFLAKKPGKAS